MRTAYHKCTCLVFGLLLAVAQLAVAGGKKEDPLAAADALFGAKNLSGALSSSIDVFLNDPETLDEVGKRLLEILDGNEEAIRILQGIFDLDLSTPEGIAAGKKILSDVRGVDSAPNKELQTQLARIDAQLRLEETKRAYSVFMDEVLPTVRAGQYLEAAAMYRPGLRIIARGAYDETDYTLLLAGTVYANLKTTVEGLISRLESAIDGAVSRSTALETAVSTLQTAVAAGNPSAISTAVSGLVGELNALDRNRDAVVAIGNTINTLYGDLYADQEVAEYYLAFAKEIITGRDTITDDTGAEVAVREGIYRVLEMQWEAVARRAGELLEAAAAAQVAAVRRQVATGAYPQVPAAVALARTLARESNNLLLAWSTQFRVNAGYRLSSAGRPIIAAVAPLVVLNQERAGEVDEYELLAARIAYLSETSALISLSGDTGLARLGIARGGIQTRRTDLAGQVTGWQTELDRYRRLASSPLGSAEALASATTLAGLLSDAVARMDREETRLAENEAAIELAVHEREYERLTGLKRTGTAQVNGLEVSVSGTSRVEVHPAEGRATLTQVRNDLSVLAGRLGEYAGAWQAEAAHIRASTVVQGYLTRDRQIVAAIDRDRTEIAALISSADEKLRLAALRKSTGLQRFEQAKRDVQSNTDQGFTDAQDNVGLANAALVESLSYAEDAEVRRIVDVELTEFGDTIIAAQKALVTRDVRRLLGEGKALFDQGEYTGANDKYLEAQARRAVAFLDPDPEIEFALRSIAQTIAFQNQREVTVTNPLYDVVSQLYNNARAAFVRAQGFQTQGLKVDQAKALDEAKQLINTMRGIVPYYKDMRLLDLEVKRLEDITQFTADFAKMYRDAVAKLKALPGDALGELEDLAGINKDYPGLSDAIYQARLALGIIKIPPKPADTATSTRLTTEARALYAKRGATDTDYVQALALLNRAIELWPDNADATNLKDVVTNMRSGGGLKLTLSAESQRQYQDAQSKFSSEDYFGARRVIEALLASDPAARNYRPLLDLQRRVNQVTVAS